MISIIPKPNRIREGAGEFVLTKDTVILTTGSGAKAVGKYLANGLKQNPISGKLWIIEKGRIRFYQQED